MTTERVERLRDLLQREFAPVQLEIRDDSAMHAGHAGAREGGHFHVTLVSDAFRGHTPLQRHRLVYAAVGELMGRGIHALSIVARTPEEAT